MSSRLLNVRNLQALPGCQLNFDCLRVTEVSNKGAIPFFIALKPGATRNKLGVKVSWGFYLVTLRGMNM